MKTNVINNLSHTVWDCKYHVAFAPKFRRKVAYGDMRVESIENLKYKYENKIFWCRKYFIDMAEKENKAIAEYIKNQL